LTIGRGQGTLDAMSSRPTLVLLFVLVLALLVCASSITLTPPGQGSFSAVHGPSSIFVAKRAASRVLSFIRAAFVVAQLSRLPIIDCSNIVNNLTSPSSDHRILARILTC